MLVCAFRHWASNDLESTCVRLLHEQSARSQLVSSACSASPSGRVLDSSEDHLATTMETGTIDLNTGFVDGRVKGSCLVCVVCVRRFPKNPQIVVAFVSSVLALVVASIASFRLVASSESLV